MGTVLCTEDATKVQIISKKIHRFLIAFHGLLLETIVRMHSQAMVLVRSVTLSFISVILKEDLIVGIRMAERHRIALLSLLKSNKLGITVIYLVAMWTKRKLESQYFHFFKKRTVTRNVILKDGHWFHQKVKNELRNCNEIIILCQWIRKKNVTNGQIGSSTSQVFDSITGI